MYSRYNVAFHENKKCLRELRADVCESIITLFDDKHFEKAYENFKWIYGSVRNPAIDMLVKLEILIENDRGELATRKEGIPIEDLIMSLALGRLKSSAKTVEYLWMAKAKRKDDVKKEDHRKIFIE